ncbi:hypothetical protein [Lewinella sp. IMCC34183]|uniref:hypothetical protein n=1 Tax=Lewinella sp. IMCC34183 TaxID=2248762 RepID=UPI0013003CD7|nr:hypothetical protein [Lewinella sp. IMCC34183]
MTFDRFHVYALRADFTLPFHYVVCLSSTALNHRHEVKNLSFLPVIDAGPHADRDPFRVPLVPTPGGVTRLPHRMYAAVDAIQSINKAALQPAALGRLQPVEEREVREKLANWLGLD